MKKGLIRAEVAYLLRICCVFEAVARQPMKYERRSVFVAYLSVFVTVFVDAIKYAKIRVKYSLS